MIDDTIKNYINDVAIKLNSTSNEHLLRVSSVIKELNAYIDHKLDLSSKGIEERIDYLVGYFTITLDNPFYKGLKILRARKFEEGIDAKPCFKSAQELSYPPPEFASLGRCNKKNESIFYGCIYSQDIEKSVNIAFSEVRALKYERVNILDAITKDEIKLRFIGIYDYIFRDAKPYFLSQNIWIFYQETVNYMKEKFSGELFVAYQLCDAFFADVLRKKGTTRLYNVTSILSGMFLESKKADGILYVSVASEGSPIVALCTETVDEKLECKNAISYEITENYGYSKYEVVKLYKGKVVDDNIEWDYAK